MSLEAPKGSMRYYLMDQTAWYQYVGRIDSGCWILADICPSEWQVWPEVRSPQQQPNKDVALDVNSE